VYANDEDGLGCQSYTATPWCTATMLFSFGTCNNTLQHTGQCRILAVYNTQDVGYELLQSDGTKSLVFTHSHRSLQQYGNNALQQHTATTHCNTQGNEGYGLRIVAGRWHENSCLHRLTPLTATTYCNNKLEQHTATTHCNNALQHAGQ